MLLQLAGHQTRTAADGLSALDAFAAFKPDVVVLDIGLPNLDGYAVARALRSRWPNVAVQLIALSGYGRDEDRTRARDAGFNEHLTKPLQFEDLLQLLGTGREQGSSQTNEVSLART